MERAYRRYQNGQVWAPGITEYCLYSSLNFRKNKRYMENVAGENGLALQQLFPYKSSYFFKISNCHKISFLNDGDPKLGYLDIFDMLFPFLKFAKLWPKILWKVGHVMAWLQRAYWLEEWKAFVDFVGIKNATFKVWQYNPLSLARATLKAAEI